MKVFKSCLTVLLIIVALILAGIYFYTQKLNETCRKDHKKVEESFSILKRKLQERNSVLKKSNFSDSTKILAKNSDSILNVTVDANKILWTEFYLNEIIFKSDSLKVITEELDMLKGIYNSDLRSFNMNWIIFPYNLIKIQQKFPKYNYLEIDYGKTNLDNMKKRKETEHWIETGEWK